MSKSSNGDDDDENNEDRNVIEIDASYGEGGGQIVRNACAYTALLLSSSSSIKKQSRPRIRSSRNRHHKNVLLHLTNIRSKRPRPGLQRQHLVGIEMLAELVSSLTTCGDSTRNTSTTTSTEDDRRKKPIIPPSASSFHSPQQLLKDDFVTSQEIWFGIGAPEVTTENTGGRYSSFTSSNNISNKQINDQSNPNPKRSRYDSTDNQKILQEPSLFTERRQFVGDTGTAGSICLLIQATLPFALLHLDSHAENTPETKSRNRENDEVELIFRGGTNATLAPPYDYFEHVFLPTLKQNFGIDDSSVKSHVVRRGFYPKGGGEVRVQVKPCRKKLNPIVMKQRGDIVDIIIRSFSGGKCPRSVAIRMAKAAESYINEHYYSQLSHSSNNSNSNSRRKPRVIIEEFRDSGILGSGSGILIVATSTNGYRLAGSAIGSHKISPETSGQSAARELVDCLLQSFCSNGDEILYPCVDEYLQDQLIIYMVLADGISEIICGSFSLHTQTAIWLAEKIFAGHGCDKTTSTDGKQEPDNRSDRRSPLFEVIRLDGKDENHILPDGKGCIPGLHLIRCHGIGFGKEN